MNTEKLFSYGTLQYESVQIANFGRKLNGHQDVLSGFILSTLEINKPDVIHQSGDNIHPIIWHSANPKDQVKGTVFEISLDELHRADLYEVSDYKRVQVRLDSGLLAWAYVRATSE